MPDISLTATKSHIAKAMPAHAPLSAAESTRETVEAIVVAIILTVTFRTFLGENYQIPTGSMAPTLQGRHMDLVCDECGFQYRTGASSENPGNSRGEVLGTTCPNCRYSMQLDKRSNVNHRSFSGDRIIVSKVAYLFDEPKRWDVIVFKYPGDPKVNYIKRLVGLPGEKLMIRHGDVFTLASANESTNGQRFVIARKPPEKVLAMLQLVSDSNHPSPALREVGWPASWVVVGDGVRWESNDDGRAYSVAASEVASWLRYRHVPASFVEWDGIVNGPPPATTDFQGQLITDFYEYNSPRFNDPHHFISDTDGLNWVGDLAIECDLQVKSGEGEVLLDLVEGGTHHRCRFDVATGATTLLINAGSPTTVAAPSSSRTGSSALRGPGKHRVRFANVDDELFVWVDDKLVQFDKPTTFESRADLGPVWSPDDAGDLQPIGIGARNVTVQVSRLRVLRDVYYVAVRRDMSPQDCDFENPDPAEIQALLKTPSAWATSPHFRQRRSIDFTLDADQFFPMGDNSPQSQDGRLWSYWDGPFPDPPPYVRRELLIGKAVLVYWPHGWSLPGVPLDVIPNFARIGRIK